MFNIEKGVPLPQRTGAGRRTIYPFDTMQSGDSFLVPSDLDTDEDKQLARVARSCVLANRRHGVQGRFIARAEKTGIRVWRTS